MIVFTMFISSNILIGRVEAQDGTFQPLDGSSVSRWVAEKVEKSPLEKLKKIVRNVIAYTEAMQRRKCPMTRL